VEKMQLPFGNLQLVNALPQRPGFTISSPASGQVQPLEQSPIPAAAAGFYGAGVTFQLQGHQLFAPFDGLWLQHDQCGQQLSLQHPNGLRLQMRFPPECAKHHGQGFHWQMSSQTQVKAGQLLLNFDGAMMQQWCKPLLLTITLPQQDKLSRISCRPVYHQASIDTLFFIDVKNAA
jgi:phosphotransferase system IIA component